MRTWAVMVGVAALTLLGMDGRLLAADEKPVDLQVGAAAPTFEGKDDAGKPWKSADHIGKKVVVLYFYPGDFTPGCTAQARNFRDAMNKLTDGGVEVIGISGDAVRSHDMFKKAQKLNFTLLADEDGSLAKKFGVPVAAKVTEVKARGEDGKIMKDNDGADVVIKRAVTIERWTFIIGKDGKILYKNPKVNPTEDTKQVAAFIEQMQKK
jgi:thioredoxin-dependent peroxiredoxin